MQEIREKAKLIGMLLTPNECDVLVKVLHNFNRHESRADFEHDEVNIIIDMICDLGKMRIGN